MKEKLENLQIELAEINQFLNHKKIMASSSAKEIALKRIKKLEIQDEIKELLKPKLDKDENTLILKRLNFIENPLDFLDNFTKEHKTEVSPRGVIFDNKKIYHIDFKSEVILAYSNLCISYERIGIGNKAYPNSKPVSPHILQSAMQKWYRLEKTKQREKLIESIKFDPSATDESLKKWLRLLTGEVIPWQLAIVKHWIQQVKRKLLRLPVEYHIFLIIYGAGEDGKTKAIDKLNSPLIDLTLDFVVEDITNSTYIGSFQDNAIIFCDELVKADKADMGAVKRAITATTLSGRPPYGAVVETVEQNCSFIAASNSPVKDLFKDDGMRRFAQINSIKRTIEQYSEMDKLNSIDIWKCVDENAQNIYYNSERVAIKLHQSTLCTQQPIDVWAEEHNVGPSEKMKWITFNELFKSFTEWLEENQLKFPTSSLEFSRKLSKLKIHPDSYTPIVDDKKYSCYKVSSECNINSYNQDVIRLMDEKYPKVKGVPFLSLIFP